MGHAHAHTPAGANKKGLAIVFCLTTAYLIAEVVGGLMTGSLALLADAGHMLTDVAGLGLALLAIKFAERPATPERTYGYYRVEILAALTNAVVLIGISLYILYEAWERFRNPPQVESGTMLVVASIGLAINIAGIIILRKGSKDSLNMKGAYFEVLSDMLTSVGVIVAGVIMLTTGWYYADWLWALRGFLDLLAGGAGLRRGRRHPDALRPGDPLDFWRVEALEPDRRLRLQAEMRLPGRAWLDFEVEPTERGARITQTASYDPLGLAGLLYWYGLYPAHALVFAGMLRGIAEAAEGRRPVR